MTQELQRFIPFDGCVNFRDLGGYFTVDGRTVKWRRLFRSDALHDMTAADVGRAVAELGISSVVDLRSRDELENDGVSPFPSPQVAYHQFPLLEGRVVPPHVPGEEPAERLAAIYLWMLANSGGLLAQTIDVLAGDALASASASASASGGGTVFHCSAGKDRTGVISALVLGILGVPAETIVADYLLTNEVIDGILARIRGMQPNTTLTAATIAAQPVAMQRFLEVLHETHGGPEAYLTAHGISEPTFATLRNRLLD